MARNYYPGIRYSDLIRAETPGKRRRYFDDRSFRLEQDAIEESQRQQREALAEQQRQFEGDLGLREQQIKNAQQQARTANTISGLGLAKSAYPYLKKGYNTVTGLGEGTTQTYSPPTREIYGLPSRPDYNPQFPDTAINDPNAPVVDPNVGVSPQSPDIAVNDVNAPFLNPVPEDWGTPLQRMYPDIAMNEPGPTSGVFEGGGVAGSAGADVTGLGPNGVFSGYEGASTGTTTGGSAGGYLGGGGPLLGAAGLLLDAGEGGPISQTVDQLFGATGLGGGIANLFGIGNTKLGPSYNRFQFANPISGTPGDESFYAQTASVPNPNGRYTDLYKRANIEDLLKGHGLNYTDKEFSDFIKTLQGLDKGKQEDDFGANLASLPAMF